MTEHLVVDANIVVKWLVEESDSGIAESLLDGWLDQGIHLAAPCFMPAEVANALHRRVENGELPLGGAVSLMRTLAAYGIALEEPPGIHERALEWANILRQPAAYDAHYLALAEHLGCDLWTADRRFFSAAREATENVRLLEAASG